MKITVHTTVTVDKANGSQTVLGRTHIVESGDNPAFERNETANALLEAESAFIAAHSLAGTRPL